jgi:hypothetical protein
MKGGNAPKKFEIYPWSKEIEEGGKYLEKRKTGGVIRDTRSWGVESNQEHKDSMEEPRNHHQWVLEPSTECS